VIRRRRARRGHSSISITGDICGHTSDETARSAVDAQLHIRNTTLVAVSRAPYDKLAAFRERMGWTFPWYSSAGSDFNYDFHVTVDDRVAPVLLNYRTEAELAAAAGSPWTESLRGDWPGISAFRRVGDTVYHTYVRGIEFSWAASNYFDLTALGRQDEWEEPNKSEALRARDQASQIRVRACVQTFRGVRSGSPRSSHFWTVCLGEPPFARRNDCFCEDGLGGHPLA
jgi:predicted dithiol-disulfide oxidoreductase (DUF899 family)